MSLSREVAAKHTFVTYTRTSTEKQDEGMSKEAQEQACLEFIHSFTRNPRVSIAARLNDTATAFRLRKGRRLNRVKNRFDRLEMQDHQKMLFTALSAMKGCTLVVAAADRFCRNVEKAKVYLDLCEKNGHIIVALRPPTEDGEIQNPLIWESENDTAALLEEIRLAERESQEISRRVKASNHHKRQLASQMNIEAYTGGGVPLGKRVDSVTVRGTGKTLRVLVPDEDERRVITEIRQLERRVQAMDLPEGYRNHTELLVDLVQDGQYHLRGRSLSRRTLVKLLRERPDDVANVARRMRNLRV